MILNCQPLTKSSKVLWSSAYPCPLRSHAPCANARQAQEAFYKWPYLVPEAAALVRRINPKWDDGDGLCRRCFDSVTKTLDDAEHQAERLDSQTGFRSYYRYVLSKRESVFWHHANPELRKWRRRVIIEDACAAADSAGFGVFAVFDIDEGLLAQGA